MMTKQATKTSECITKSKLVKDSKIVLRRFLTHTKVGHHMYLPIGNLQALEKLVEEKVNTQYPDLIYQTEDIGGMADIFKNILATCRETLDVSDEIIMQVEAILAFLYNLRRVDGMTSLVVALTSLSHGLRSKSAVNLVSVLVGHFKKCFGMFERQAWSENLENFENFIDFTRENLDFCEDIRETPLMQKLYKFVCFCASYSIFDRLGIDFDFLGFNKFEAHFIKEKHTSKTAFMYAFFDFITLFLKQSIQAVKIGSYEPFYHSNATHADWVATVITLKNQEKLVNDPDPHGFDIFDYRARLETAIEHGNAIMRISSNMPKFARDRYAKLCGDLQLLKTNDISKRSAQRDRPAPFGVLLYGGSSLGKSTLINVLFQYYAARFGLSNDTSSKYTRNPGEKYWNNFSSSQWCIVMDDIAAQSATLGTADPSLQEIIGVMNNVAYQPDQASIDDKGRTPMRAELVIATTNTEHLNAHAYFSCPLAVQRRLPYVIEVVVKQEFQTMGMLDHTKVVKEEGRYPNFWDFTVKKVVPASDATDNRRGITINVARFENIESLLQWFGNTADVHRKVQAQIGKEDKETASIKVCTICGLPDYVCVCGTGWRADDRQALTIGDNSTNWYRTVYGHQEDILDVLYTFMHLCFWTIYNYFVLAFGGIITYYIFGGMFTQWFNDCFTSDRVFGFIVRRLPFGFTRRFNRLIPYVKVMTLLLAGSACANLIMDKVLPKRYFLITKDGKLVAAKDPMEIQKIAGKTISTKELTKSYTGDIDQQGCEDIGKIPQAVKEQRQNVWYKNDFVVSNFDVSVTTASWKALDAAQVRSLIRKNVVRVEIGRSNDNLKRRGAMLALGGQLYATNKHSLFDDHMMTFNIIRSFKCSGVNGNITCVVTRSQMFFPENSDIVYIAIPNLPPAKDLTCLLPEDTFTGIYSGEYVGYSADMIPYTNTVDRIVANIVNTPNGSEHMFMGRSKILTVKGDCGNPLIITTSMGPVLGGIHSVGDQNQVVGAARIFKDDVKKAYSELHVLSVQCGEPLLNAPSAPERCVLALDERSPFRYLEEGYANVYGSLSGPRVAHKSAVVPTFFADIVKKYDYRVKFGKPTMKGWKPWRIAALDMTNIPMGFRHDILETAVEAFSEDIIGLLTPDDLKQVHVYDMFTAINGAAGVAYVDKMNRGTSAGFPWNTSKRKFIEAIGELHDLPDPVDITPEIRDRVEIILNRYREGKRYMPVFNGNLKDEPTKFAKCESGKTRVFGGAPFDWSIVNRMYMLPLIRLMQDNRYIFEGAPGTITQSREWSDMYDYLTYFGKDRIVAGDYKSFDKSMSPVFILAAFRIMRNICEVAGYDDESLKIVDGLAADTAFPLFNLNGDLVEFYGSNPSGHPLTVIVNGLANALYMRYCYLVLNPDHECKSFKKNVHLMTYGDDNVMGVDINASWFNHTTIQKVLADHGVTYTMADKESESVPFINIDDVTFLKRAWVWNDGVQAHLAPLEHESIEKMLLTCVESKSVCPQQQALSIATSAVNEYFFYGRDVFEAKRAMLLEIIKEAGMEYYYSFSPFPTWDELVERFESYKITQHWKSMLKKD
nr:MAG: hypothetical protein 1 [Marnaviridae sp.]